MAFIGLIFFLIIVGYLLSGGSEIWFLEEQQQSFRETLSTLEKYVSERGEVSLALTPLQYLTVFLNRYLGDSLISRRAIKLTTLLAIGLMVSTIWYTVLTDGKGSFTHSPPWKMHKSSIERLRFVSEKEIDKDEDEESRAARDALNKRYAALISILDSKWGVVVYIIIYFALCVLLAGILTCLSLAITRQIIREMLFAKGVFTPFSLAIVNVFLVLILGSSALLLLFIYSFPAFWPSVELLCYGLTSGTLWAVVTYLGSTILAFFLIADWIKYVVLVSLFPCIVLLLALWLCVVSYLFKKPIHIIVLRLVQRSLEWKAGPIAFFATLFTFLTVIIGLLGQYVF